MAGTFEVGSIIARLKGEDSDLIKTLKSSVTKAKVAGRQITAALKSNLKIVDGNTLSKSLKSLRSFAANARQTFNKIKSNASTALLAPFRGFQTGFKTLLSTTRNVSSGISKAFLPITKTFQFARRAIFSVQGALVSFGAAFTGIALVQRAKEVEAISSAFDSLSKSVGALSGPFLKGLRTAVRGTVSDLDLMRVTNQATLLGVVKSQEEFIELADIARRLGRAVGRGPVEALSDLSTGIGRQSRLILDNLGIIVKIEEANRKYALELGVAAEALSDSEKRQAFYNATLDAGKTKVATLGEDFVTVGEQVGRFSAAISNTATTVAQAFVSGGPFSAIADFLEDNQKKIGAFAQFFAETFSNLVSTITSTIQGLFSGSFAGGIARSVTELIRIVLSLATKLLLTGINVLFSNFTVLILELLGTMFGSLLTRLRIRISNVFDEATNFVLEGILRLSAKVPGLSELLGLDSPEGLEKALSANNFILKAKLAEADKELEHLQIQTDRRIGDIGKDVDAEVAKIAGSIVDDIKAVVTETGKQGGLIGREFSKFLGGLEKSSQRLKISQVDVFQGFQDLSLQNEIQQLGDEFNKLVGLRRSLIQEFPEQIGEEEVRRSGELLTNLQKVLETTNKKFLEFVKGPKEAKKALGEEFVSSLRQSEAALQGASASFLEFGRENLETASKTGKANEAVLEVKDSIESLAKVASGGLGLQGLAAAFSKALAPVFLASDDFENLIKKFQERERALTLEVRTLGLSDSQKDVELLDAAIEKFQSRFSPEQITKVDALREALRTLGEQKEASAVLEELTKQIDQMGQEAAEAQLQVLALQENEMAATFASINREVKVFEESVRASGIAMARQNQLISEFRVRSEELKSAIASREVEEFKNEIESADERLVSLNNRLLGLREGTLAVSFAEINQEVAEFTRRVRESNIPLAEQNRLIAARQGSASRERVSVEKIAIREDIVGPEVSRIFEQRIGGALVKAFRSGESVSKQWADVTAGFFEDSLQKAIKSLSGVITEQLSKAFGSASGAAGATGLASGLIGIAGLILNQLNSKTSSTVEDFSQAINSSEAVRGVVAGPSNVAISKIGDSLKQALRTTEVLLERIALSVEGRSFGGAGASTGNLNSNSILPLTGSTEG